MSYYSLATHICTSYTQNIPIPFSCLVNSHSPSKLSTWTDTTILMTILYNRWSAWSAHNFFAKRKHFNFCLVFLFNFLDHPNSLTPHLVLCFIHISSLGHSLPCIIFILLLGSQFRFSLRQGSTSFPITSLFSLFLDNIMVNTSPGFLYPQELHLPNAGS